LSVPGPDRLAGSVVNARRLESVLQWRIAALRSGRAVDGGHWCPSYADTARRLAKSGSKGVLPPDQYPLLAYFEDISRPERWSGFIQTSWTGCSAQAPETSGL
jgi:hypothetical protein